MPRIAAVDFGIKRIGLAISDEKGRIALPLKMVSADKSLKASARNILQALTPYVGQIEVIIVGLPLTMSGKTSEMAVIAERFAKELQNQTKSKVIMMDERLTTSQAERLLKELSYSRKQRTQIIDSTSAVILLQTYLDKNHESS